MKEASEIAELRDNDRVFAVLEARLKAQEAAFLRIHNSEAPSRQQYEQWVAWKASQATQDAFWGPNPPQKPPAKPSRRRWRDLSEEEKDQVAVKALIALTAFAGLTGAVVLKMVFG